jgi:serine/threonine-protein kinase RsbW
VVSLAEDPPGTDPKDVVDLRVPADPSYVAIVRLAATGLAAHGQLTLDDIEDLRLAVDEACSLVLPHAVAGSPLDVRFEVEEGCLTATVGVRAEPGAQVDLTGFTWTVLSALVSAVEVSHDAGRLLITLTRRRPEAHL